MFIPNYSIHVQVLYAMTANDYDWKACWTPLEIAAFADLKQAVLDCCLQTSCPQCGEPVCCTQAAQQ